MIFFLLSIVLMSSCLSLANLTPDHQRLLFPSVSVSLSWSSISQSLPRKSFLTEQVLKAIINIPEMKWGDQSIKTNTFY